MKYIAIIDDDMLNEKDKREWRVPILEKEKNGISYVNLKPLLTHVLTETDGESLYLPQRHFDCLVEYSQKVLIEQALKKESIEQTLKKEEMLYDGLRFFADKIVKMKESK